MSSFTALNTIHLQAMDKFSSADDIRTFIEEQLTEGRKSDASAAAGDVSKAAGGVSMAISDASAAAGDA